MKKVSILVLVIAVCVCAFFMVADVSRAQGVNGLQAKGPAAGTRGLIPSGNVKVDVDFAKVPLYFIANKSQVNEQARFYARASRYTLWLTREGMVFDGIKRQDTGEKKEDSPITPHHSPTTKHGRDVSRLMFIGANPNPEMKAVNPAALKVNYFIGNDRSKWNCDVPTSLAVQYGNLYKNIDLQVYGIEKQIEYDWLVRPGGDPAAIRFAYKEIKGSRIDKDGNLVIETRFGEWMHKKPLSYQVIDSKKQAVDVTFKKTGKDSFGFSVGQYDHAYDLIIDPLVLVYSTYLGGSGEDYGKGIAVDGSGNVYVTGATESMDFPTTPDRYQTYQGGEDAFVTKLDPSQSGAAGLLYSTYLGGGASDSASSIAIDGSGNAYVTGWTTSTDFPTLNQYQAEQKHGDVFVTKLDPSQSGAASLLYSTYLGGNYIDDGYGIAVDGSGYAYVTGGTRSTDFPTLNHYQADQGVGDVFVAKLDPSQSGAASLLYSTYLGGGAYEFGYGIAVDGSGHAYVTGTTTSMDFPTLNRYQASQGGNDVFVAKLDPSQSGTAGLLYSTYLGGGNNDHGLGIAIDGSGHAYVTGYTVSTDFPTIDQYQTYQGGNDVFVAKLDPTQSGVAGLLYSTYLGGRNSDRGYGIAVDGSGHAYVTGCTYSRNFPTLHQFQSFQGSDDVFVTKISFVTPFITVTSPDGGENWKLSSSQNITWNAVGISGLLKITLWKGGTQIGIIADDVNPAAGLYAWTVGTLSSGSMVAVGSDYKIKIKEIGTAIADSSNANFTLSPGITVTAPNGGQTWTIGSVKQITWRSGGLTNQIKISLWKDNVLLGTIATVAPADSPYAWTVGSYTGGTAAAGTGYTIKIKENGTAVADTSDATFQLIL